MSGKKHDTLIFIATYNERGNVEAMCAQILALTLQADILFIDDNSPDGTGEVLDRLAAQHDNISIIHRSGKLGLGSAHLDGIARAYDLGYDTLITMDCDFTHSPRDIPVMLAASADADITVASRFQAQASLAEWTFFRKSLSWCGHFLTRTLLGMGYDATGAFRVYRLSRLPRQVFSLVRSRGYAFFFESLFILHVNKFKIVEVPIALPKRSHGESKMSLKEAFRSALRVLRLWFDSRRHPEHFRLPATDGGQMNDGKNA